MLAAPAHAIDPAQAETHDDVYVRLAIGAGYQTLLAPDRGTRYRTFGAAVGTEIDVGGEVAENLILHVTVLHWSMILPTHLVAGQEVDSSGGQASAIAVGPGLTYYVMPWNIFFSLTIGLGRMFMTRPAEQTELGDVPFEFASNTGWMVHGMVGKEWWVDDQWLVGAGAFAMISVFPEPGGFPTWGGPLVGARVTVAYD